VGLGVSAKDEKAMADDRRQANTLFFMTLQDNKTQVSFANLGHPFRAARWEKQILRSAQDDSISDDGNFLPVRLPLP